MTDEQCDWLIKEYLHKCNACDECFAEFFCIDNYIKYNRIPQSYCVDNIKAYFKAQRKHE